MDFLSRLIAGTALSPASNKTSVSNDPNKRLARFKRGYSQLTQIWRKTSNLSQDPDAIEAVRGCLYELTSILGDESRRPSPHLCISFASSAKIYVAVGKIAATCFHEPTIQEAIAFFSALVHTEEEDFLGNKTFSGSLMNLLIKIKGAIGPSTKVEVVELALKIAQKLKAYPEILPAWFAPQLLASEGEYIDEHEKFAGKTQKEDFPLFYLLIDEIHEEGDTGDFARTGLLYIIQSASDALSLEQWLVESDLATTMASGLGALYGQLSRKLVIDYPADDLPLILALSDYNPPLTSREVISSASPDFQIHIETFLAHLVFWQDVLENCKSKEVKDTLLEHFQVIFLQQLLYPSLLESSDVDGGSSVAVLNTLRRILESLNHPNMIHLILQYLLALPEMMSAETPEQGSISAARKRKSMDLASMMASQSEEKSPSIWSLVDLILISLRSKNQQTVIVSLQLVSTILRRHHHYAIITLLRTSSGLTTGQRKTIGAHEREIQFLLSCASEIGGEEDFNEAYENHVKDSVTLLESHPCSQSRIVSKIDNGNSRLPGFHASIPGAPPDVKPHTLRRDDPFLKTVFGSFETFFTNPVEINLSLTEAIIDLVACSQLRLDGWLLPDPSEYLYDDSETEGDTTGDVGNLGQLSEHPEQGEHRNIYLARRIPKWPPQDLPVLLNHLQTLTSQITIYRLEIPRFDDLLQQRRQALQVDPTQATPIPIRQPLRSSFDAASSRSASPPPSKSAFDSLAQRIFPEFSTPSRSSSPRGRRSQDQQRSGNVYSPGPHTSTVAPASATPRAAPPQFPMGGIVDTPSRGSSRAFSSSPLRGSENVAASSRAVASQAAAFAEVDKAILMRKVGMPTKKGDLVPAPFPNLSGNAKSQESSTAGDTDGTGSEDWHEARDELGDDGDDEPKSVTVSHVLTNVIVLQEFLLELAALVQVRAGLFGEVRFK